MTKEKFKINITPSLMLNLGLPAQLRATYAGWKAREDIFYDERGERISAVALINRAGVRVDTVPIAPGQLPRRIFEQALWQNARKRLTKTEPASLLPNTENAVASAVLIDIQLRAHRRSRADIEQAVTAEASLHAAASGGSSSMWRTCRRHDGVRIRIEPDFIDRTTKKVIQTMREIPDIEESFHAGIQTFTLPMTAEKVERAARTALG